MTKRLQLSFKDSEFREIPATSLSKNGSVKHCSKPVSGKSTGDVDRKLAAIRTAVLGDYPSGDVEKILSEIESGRSHGSR